MGNLTKWENALIQSKQTFIETAKQTGLDYQAEYIYALQAIKANDDLQTAAPDSIIDSMINIAAVGLSLNPADKFAYLVPHKERATLYISYLGFAELAYRSGSVRDIRVNLVYKNDKKFDPHGDYTPPTHIYDPFASREERGALRGGYCIARLSDDRYLIDFMSIEDILKVRDCSKAKNGPWRTWFEPMAKKTIIKHAAKLWPNLSDQFRKAEYISNQAEGIELENQPEPEIVRVINPEQAEELQAMMIESKIVPDKVFKAFGIEAINDLPMDRYDECKHRLTAAVQAQINKMQTMIGKDQSNG